MTHHVKIFKTHKSSLTENSNVPMGMVPLNTLTLNQEEAKSLPTIVTISFFHIVGVLFFHINEQHKHAKRVRKKAKTNLYKKIRLIMRETHQYKFF